MRHLVLVPVVCASLVLLSVRPAAAQSFIGTFSWQTAPFCNVITLNVTQAGSDYILEGFDNLCGAERRATATGVATLNPNGTVGIGLTIVNTIDVEPSHLDVVVNIATLAGTWEDNGVRNGAFVFNGAGGGLPRPLGQVSLTTFGDEPPAVLGRRANGTPAAPSAVAAGDGLLFLGGRGHVGTGISGSSEAQFVMTADEAWTPTARGTRMVFLTTTNGTTDTVERLRIDHDGQVGIGVTDPVERLDVAGNVRIGTGALGCVEDRDGDVIAGVCASDAHFKRDVLSFEPMLSKVAALRPVHFYWRTDEFPSRAFGTKQSYGLMAQEVEEILPDLVATDAEGYKAVNYSKLPLIALQAIKELKAKNDALEVQNLAIAAQNAAIERRLAEIEARLKQ